MLIVFRFKESEQAVQSLSKSETNEIMVPLTASMYVPGVVKNKDKLVVDIGAQFYAEKDCKGAIGYLERKQTVVGENTKKVGEILNSKKLQLQVVTMELQKRMQAIMAQQQQPAKS